MECQGDPNEEEGGADVLKIGGDRFGVGIDAARLTDYVTEARESRGEESCSQQIDAKPFSPA